MVNVHDKAHDLANVIKQVDEVKKLKEISNKINEDDNLKGLLKELREVQFLVFNEQRSKGELNSDIQERFREVSSRVMEDPIVSEYVKCEQRVGIIVDDIMKILNEAFGIESFI